MPQTKTTYDNLLEPPRTPDLFLQFPPEGFAVGLSPQGMPFFRTEFDLLTSFEKNAVLRLRKLPLYRTWSRLLRVHACFAGTTATEYALLPKGVAAADILSGLRTAGREDSLTIIKDLPCASPLLSEEENALADALASEAAAQGFIELQGQALAYVPIDFQSVNQYLERLSAARRKDLRRKMKQYGTLAIETLPLGHPAFSRRDLPDELYAGYLEVFAQSHIHFDLLSPEFFAALLQNRDLKGMVVLYRRGGLLIGFNICFVHAGRLIDKYIGFRYPQAREANLYFISWLHNLRFALKNRLHTYIAGWTDPEVKAGLGARFTFTRHLVLVHNPLLRALLRPFRRLFEGDRQALEAL